MKLLLDTHAIIWFITNDIKLPSATKKILENKEHDCLVSIASYWEIGIKHSIGRLPLNADLQKIFNLIVDTGFDTLPISTSHILASAALDFHHQDPFDRLMIAQAKVENLTIVSKDAAFDKYEVPLLWNL